VSGVVINGVPVIARMSIKVVPGASQDRIVGWLGEALKIRVRAQPEKGKANTAVIALLADLLKVPAGSINVASGKTSKTKIIEIRGISDAELQIKLGCLASGI